MFYLAIVLISLLLTNFIGAQIPHNGGQQQHQMITGNGQKFFVIQRDTNVLDGQVEGPQFGGGNPAFIQPPFVQQNFVSPPPPSRPTFGPSGFMVLQQPQTFIPTTNVEQGSFVPSQQQLAPQNVAQQQPFNRVMNQGFIPQQNFRQPQWQQQFGQPPQAQTKSPSEELPPMLNSPQLGAQDPQQPREPVVSSSTQEDCPQPAWKEIMEKAIQPGNPDASINAVQQGLSRAARGTFIVVCAPAEHRQMFASKLRLNASGNNYCHVIRERVWCHAVAMGLGRAGQSISLGMGRR